MGLVALQHVGSSWIRDQTCVPYIARQILSLWTTREVPEQLLLAFMELTLWRRNKVFFYFKDFVCVGGWWGGPFLKSLLNLLQYCFCCCFYFFAGRPVESQLQPGIEPTPLALRGRILNTGSPGKSLGKQTSVSLWDGDFSQSRRKPVQQLRA